MSDYEFVIVAPRYNEQQGGSIVLHYLCHYLNELGYRAGILPKYLIRTGFSGSMLQRTRAVVKGLRLSKDFFCSDLNTPLVEFREVGDAIAIYSEKMQGNPLGARHVVRWLLHRPGFHGASFRYGAEDLLFFYTPAFNTISLPESRRFYFPVLLKTFFDLGRSDRSGTCYLLRKGRERVADFRGGEGIILDGYNNIEMNAQFNAHSFLISYDLHTFYCQYAAICGCIPIVVPEKGVSREQWQPDSDLRLGIAYGEEDVDWAIETRPQLLAKLAEQEAESERRIRHFAECVLQHFDRGNQVTRP